MRDGHDKKEKEKTAKCRLCGKAIPITPGMEELSDHWEMEHLDELYEMRKAYGEPEDY